MGSATSVADRTPAQAVSEASAPGAGSGAAIWERIRLRVEERLRVIERHAHRVLDREVTSAEATSASAAAGALASELGRLELPGIARLARHLVGTLSREALDASDAVHVAGTTEDIRTLLSSAIAQQESTAFSRGTIVAVGPTSDELDNICWVLASRGHGVTHDEDRLVEREAPPSGVLLVVDHTVSETLLLLQAIGESWSAPIVALYEGADPRMMRALASRCSTIVPVTVSADEVCAEFARCETALAVSPVIYAHGRLSAGGARLLRAHGFRVRRVRDIDELPQVLTEASGAVIFGHGAAAHDALAVTRVIRAVPATRRSPIMWLNDPDPEQRDDARRLDVLVVDTVTDGTAVRALAALRSAEADRMEEEQASSSLLGWPAARVLTDRSLVAAQRTGGSVALAVITIDATISDERRTQVIESLGREFRREDVIGLRDDRTVVAALQGVSRRVASHRLSSFMRRADLEGGGTRAGVAMFPEDGRSADELARVADEIRRVAIENGGPAVVSTTWRPVSEQVVDVLIVQPDRVLADMLASIMTERDLRAEVLDNGNAALEWITDRERGAAPRLLLVDLDTAGLDGLSLVRRLRRAGVLTQVSVLLMTARSSESDLRVALDLGVSDIIRKPFSATLLLHRVDRLLEDQ